MKNAPQPNFAHVDRGQHVLVWLKQQREVVEARVQSGVRHGEFRVRWTTRQPNATVRRTYSIKRRDEGTTWMIGWEGEAADAFRAFHAMEESTRAVGGA